MPLNYLMAPTLSFKAVQQRTHVEQFNKEPMLSCFFYGKEALYCAGRHVLHHYLLNFVYFALLTKIKNT